MLPLACSCWRSCIDMFYFSHILYVFMQHVSSFGGMYSCKFVTGDCNDLAEDPSEPRKGKISFRRRGHISPDLFSAALRSPACCLCWPHYSECDDHARDAADEQPRAGASAGARQAGARRQTAGAARQRRRETGNSLRALCAQACGWPEE